MQANDHWVSFASFAVARRPEAANQNLARTLPDKKMLEALELLSQVELFPGPGINLSADAFYIKDGFGEVETFSLQAQILDMVVPARMFAEGGQAKVASIDTQSSSIFQQKFFRKVAHLGFLEKLTHRGGSAFG